MAKKTPPSPDAVDAAAAPAWEPPSGQIVRDEREYHLWIDGVRYRHVDDAPDGRWVYTLDQ